MKIKKLIGKISTTILWSLLTIITLLPIYWMVLVSTRTPVELFGKPDLSPTFFEKVHWKNFTKPFIDGIYSDYLMNSIIIATSNAALVTVLALMATYALSRFKLPGSESIFFWKQITGTSGCFLIAIVFTILHCL